MSWYSFYNNYKTINYTAGEGAGTNYQMIVKVYKSAGTDGTETLNHETVTKIYVDDKCRDDFNDIRFMSLTTNQMYKQYKTSVSSGASAVFAVLVTETMDSDRSLRIYYNSPDASADVSDSSVFIDVIGGVVGGWPMDEANAVDPVLDYSGNGNDGTATGTTIVASPYIGKNTRNFELDTSDKVTLTNDAVLNMGVADFSIFAYFKSSTESPQEFIAKRTQNIPNWVGYDFRVTAIGLVAVDVYDGVTSKIAYSKGGVDLIDGAWHVAIATVDRDGDASVFVDNGASDGTPVDFSAVGNIDNVQVAKIGTASDDFQFMDGSLSNIILFTGLLGATARTNLMSYYPDVGLVAGSVLVRKHATTTLPTLDSVDNEETNYPDGGEKYYYYKTPFQPISKGVY